MKLSLVSTALLLGAAAATEPLVFGRGRSRRLRASKSTPKRIWPKASKAVTSDVGTAKSSSGSELQAKTAEAKASKFAKSVPKGSSSSDDGPAIWSKTAKRSKMSADRFDAGSKAFKSSEMWWADSFDAAFFAAESMSLAMSVDSMSFDFSMPAVKPPTTATPPGPSSDDRPNWGPLIFQYLGQCTGVGLPGDSCLASKTIDAFMAMNWDEGASARMRFLGKSVEPNEADGTARGEAGGECGPPAVTEEMLREIMGKTSKQCEDVSDEEFNTVLDAFLRQLSHQDCWEALCGEGDDISKLFMTLLFNQAAECANVELDVDKCVIDHVVELILDVDTPTTRGVRRVLQQEEDPCDTPSESDFAFFVSFMLIDAQAECSEKGVDLSSTDWSQVSSDLVTIFASPECWGSVDCGEQSSVGIEAFSADYSWPTAAPVLDDEKESRFVITDNGSQCIFEMETDPELERDLVLTFYYRVETASSDAPSLAGIEEAVQGIESALIETICSYEERGRRLEQEETTIVSVDSAPQDVVTDYVCTPGQPDATSCFVVEGKTTLTVEGESAEHDADITADAYEELEQLFLLIQGTLGDPNVVDVRYLGQDPPAADSSPTIDKLLQDDDDSASYAAVLIASAGGLVAMALIITGFKRMNSKEDDEDSAVPAHKPDDSDGQSTAYRTADLTYDNSCDRSDNSYLPSPARSTDLISPSYANPSPAKFFVVAEEEEQNWRELSILPALAQDTLEGVSEEGEFIGDIRRTSSCEMSV